jgi:cephalosporin-C deacetylase-like acetyl esterase
MLLALPVLALLQIDPSAALLKWMDGFAQSYLNERQTAIAKIDTRQKAAERNRVVRAKILELIGGLPDYRGPLNARILGRIDEPAYTVDKLVFESLPRYYVTANLYAPKLPGKHPGILFPIGHWDQGKAIAQRMAANFALKGFVVLAYDPIGQGERLQAYDSRTGKSLAGGSTEQHILAGAQSLLIGESFARYRIWDAKRALDYLLSRPEVDSARIGCTGCSGGGTVTTYISALDDRIKVAAPSCYMNSWRLLFSGPTGDSEQSFANFLSSGLDEADYVELFAPKPWLMTSTERDFFTPAGAKIVYDESRRWYGIYGATDKLKWVVGPGGHGTPQVLREAIYDWMLRWLNNSDGSPKEQDIALRPDQDFQVTRSGQTTIDFDGRETFDVIRERYDRSVQQSSADDLRQYVSKLVNHHAPSGVHMRNGTASIDVDDDLSIEANVFPGHARSSGVLIVGHSKQNEELARKLAAAGETAMVLAPRGTPEPATQRLSGDWITNMRAMLIGRNLPAMRAHDILCGVDVLSGLPTVDPSRIRVIASDTAGVWALLAAAADHRISRVELDRTPYSLRKALDSPLSRNLHDAVIPGFVERWDLSDLVTVIGRERVTWRDPTDWMRNVAALPGFEYSTFAQ